MPIDTSIYKSNPLRSVADYEQELNAVDLQKQSMQQNALNLQTGRLGLAEKQRAIAEQGQIRNVLAGLGPGADDTMRISALKGTGLPGGFAAADALQKAQLDQEKVRAQAALDLASARAKEVATKQELLTHGIQSLQVADTPEQAANAILDGVTRGYWSPEDAQKKIAAIPQEPNAYQSWRMNSLKAVLAAKDQLPKIETRDLGGALQTAAIDPLTGKSTVTASVAKTQTPESIASNERIAKEGAANRAVQMRGQDMTDARSRELNTVTKADKEETRKTEKVEKETTKFAATLQKEGIPDIEAALSSAEAIFSRYKDPKTGKLGSVPGIGAITNVLPDWAVSSEGRDVRESLAAVSNIVLSARSGAAVTDQEMRRLARELSASLGGTAEDMERAYRKFRVRFDKIKANAAAGVSDEVKRTYEERGGVPITRGSGKTDKPAAEDDAVARALKKYGQ